mgnify:CR=1 FL=1
MWQHRIILKHACQHHAVQLVNMIADADTAVLHLSSGILPTTRNPYNSRNTGGKMCRISHFTSRYNGRLESNTPTRVLSMVPLFDPVRSFTKIILCCLHSIYPRSPQSLPQTSALLSECCFSDDTGWRSPHRHVPSDAVLLHAHTTSQSAPPDRLRCPLRINSCDRGQTAR